MKWKRLKKKYLRYITPFWVRTNILFDKYVEYNNRFADNWVELQEGDIKDKEELNRLLNKTESLQKGRDKIAKLLFK